MPVIRGRAPRAPCRPSFGFPPRSYGLRDELVAGRGYFGVLEDAKIAGDGVGPSRALSVPGLWARYLTIRLSRAKTRPPGSPHPSNHHTWALRRQTQ